MADAQSDVGSSEPCYRCFASSLLTLDDFYTADFVQQFGRMLDITWKYGPQWQQLWTSVWSTYDALESARAASSTPRREWQDRFEERRRKDELEQSKTYLPIDSDVSSFEKGRWPLCAALWEFEGAPLQEKRTPWKTTLESWERFLELCRDADSGFRETLSSAQRTSFHVLYDWWMCRCAPAEDVADFRMKLEGGDLDSLGFPLLEQFLHPLVAWKNHSAYHSALLSLFAREFNPMYWEPFQRGRVITFLEVARSRAITLTTRQRFARDIWDFLYEEKGEAPRDPALADALFLREYPHTAVPQYDAWGKDTVTVSLVPPTYLWDIKGRKTILVHTLPSCPEYACISHTWGRWRLSNSLDANVPVTGVPWHVPPNKLYDVQELPEMLCRLPADIQFVWFDLFCIPQDASQPAVTQQEIANQASIFRGSSRALVWLHNVENWQAVEDVLMYLAVSYLRTKCSTDPYEHVFPDYVFENAWNRANCLVPLWDLDSGKPCGWFSSLWTLQEAMLCPNIELCSRDMEVLVDPRGVPITLAALLNLSTSSVVVNSDVSSVPLSSTGTDPLADIKPPTGLELLHRVNFYTGLDVFLVRASPISLISLSGNRESSDSRAPAIMAALNVTDWYCASPPGAAQEELVLNCFPLAFVREAARKCGAKFFFTPGSFQWDRMVQEVQEDFLAPRGTILPFSRYEQFETTGLRQPTDRGDDLLARSHEAVQSWEILVDGSVRIRSAAILASSAPEEEEASGPPAPRHPIPAYLIGDTGPGCRTDGLTGNYDDLKAGLIKFAGALFELGTVVYAVPLFEDPSGTSNGVLLLKLGVTNARADASNYMIKVGIFHLHGVVHTPSSTTVDWIVL